VGGCLKNGVLSRHFTAPKLTAVFLSQIRIVFILERILYFIIRGIEAGKGWNGVGRDAFVCLRLLPVLFHEHNSICK